MIDHVIIAYKLDVQKILNQKIPLIKPTDI
jgi:hypothetical protein